MSVNLDNLNAARAAIIAELALGPTRPDYGVDGQGVQWAQRRRQMIEELEKLEEAIRYEQGPVEDVTMGIT